MKKEILVFGATGGTGSALVSQALNKNFIVNAFVRNKAKVKTEHQNLKIIEGDVLDYASVAAAVKGQRSVFCCLGMPASDRSMLRTLGTSNIVKAMDQHNVERFICQTSLGFGDSKEVLPWHMKYLVVPFILKHAFEDHERQETVIEDSNTRWTIVRPGNMTNGKLTQQYKHGFAPTEKIKLKVSRADVADFMLQQLQSRTYENQKVGISY